MMMMKIHSSPHFKFFSHFLLLFNFNHFFLSELNLIRSQNTNAQIGLM